MYVPETFQRNSIEARPYWDSGRFCARAPASSATPIPPVWTSGYTLVRYSPPGPPVAYTTFSASYASMRPRASSASAPAARRARPRHRR